MTVVDRCNTCAYDYSPNKMMCSNCAHEFEPAKPAYKAGDIVMTRTGRLLTIKEIEPCGRIRATSGEWLANEDIERLATDEEALRFWEEKATVTQNGVVMRAYAQVHDVVRVFWNVSGNTGHILFAYGDPILQALGLMPVPYEYSKGEFRVLNK